MSFYFSVFKIVKYGFVELARLFCLGTFILFFVSNTSSANDLFSILRKALDNSSHRFSVANLRVSNENCSKGMQSLGVGDPRSGLVPVLMLGGPDNEKFNTLEFDVFIPRNDGSEDFVRLVEYDLFGQTRVSKYLEGETGWHRIVAKVNPDSFQVDIQWFGSPNLIFIDNVQTSVSSKTESIQQIEGNGCTGASKAASTLVPIMELLLADDSGSSGNALVC
ncbi:MAG: hypothetical protein MK188_12605, partial [Gammaproteobacteria bacterium]|nr:hypothetical protein [Gammaproteobacteria bacterium]